MIIIKTINTTTATSLDVRDFKKMYISNASTTTDAVFTLTIMEVTSGTAEKAHILNNVTIPVSATLELEGYSAEGGVFKNGILEDTNSINVKLFATANSGEVNLIIER